MSISVSGDSSGTDTDSDNCRSWSTVRPLTSYSNTPLGRTRVSQSMDYRFRAPRIPLNDVIDGVTLNLLSRHPRQLLIDVKTDTDTIVADVHEFVDKYNTYVSTHANLTDYDA